MSILRFSQFDKIKKFIIITKKLNQLLISGFDLKKSIEIIAADEPDKAYQTQLNQLQTTLTHGDSLVLGLQNLLPAGIPFYFEGITVLPNLPQFFEELYTYYSCKLASIQKAYDRMSYPIILIGLTGFSLLFFLFYLLPVYIGFFGDLDIPIPKGLLLINWIQNFTVQYWFYLISISIFALLFGKPLIQPKLQEWIINIFFPMSIADILWILAIYLESGIDIKKALQLIKLDQYPTLKLRFQQFQSAVLQGGGFSESLCDSFSLSIYHKEQLLTLEKTPHFKQTLKTIAQEIRDFEEQKIQKFIQWIQPVMLILLAILLTGFLYLTFIPLIGTINNVI